MRNRTIFNCGLTMFASVLFISWQRIRPLGVLVLTFLGFWIYWTQCNFRIVPPMEIQKKFAHFKKFIVNCRGTRPTMFCAVTSGCLGAIALLGHLISGSTVVLTGCILAGIVLRKYNFKFVKIEFQDFSSAQHDIHAGNEFDEFFPDVNETNFFVLEDASNSATICSTNDDEEKSDEIPSELLIPDDVIPEINEQSSEDDNDDLVPITEAHNQNRQSIAIRLPIVQSCDLSTSAKKTTILSTTNVMKFHKGHFKRDSSLSSTSSEESLSKGLEFPDHTAIDRSSLHQVLSSGSIDAILPSPTPLMHNQKPTNIVAMAMKTPTQDVSSKSSILFPSIISELINCGGEGMGSRNDDNNDIISGNKISETLVLTNAASSTSLALIIRRMLTVFDSSDESDFEILETDDFK